MEHETWTPITGFPFYQVSNQGRVRRIGTMSPRGRWLKERILKQRKQGSRMRVDLLTNYGAKKPFLIPRP